MEVIFSAVKHRAAHRWCAQRSSIGASSFPLRNAARRSSRGALLSVQPTTLYRRERRARALHFPQAPQSRLPLFSPPPPLLCVTCHPERERGRVTFIGYFALAPYTNRVHERNRWLGHLSQRSRLRFCCRNGERFLSIWFSFDVLFLPLVTFFLFLAFDGRKRVTCRGGLRTQEISREMGERPEEEEAAATAVRAAESVGMNIGGGEVKTDRKLETRCRRTVICLGVACAGLLVTCMCLAVEVYQGDDISAASRLTVLPSDADTASAAAAATIANMKDAAAKSAAAKHGGQAAGSGASGGGAGGALPSGPWENTFRLPPQAIPTHYLLTLRPDLAAGTFSGDVEIRVRVTEPLPYLAVHSKSLEVLATNVTRDDEADGGTAVPLHAAFAYPPHEMWVMQPQDEGGFAPALYRLSFSFRGNLTSKIVGFYRSQYWDEATQSQRAIATSKFQPTYARQAFPCFDEPSFKSRFTIRLVRPSGNEYRALSNMNVEEEVVDCPSPGQTTVYFKESVPMVTYLACFIVSDFKNLSSVNISPGDFPLTVYSRPSQISKTEYARDLGSSITQFYINYFGIEYPLPKLDLIAIPDFVSGAMEHWGLVTFRETALLFDPKENSVINKQRVATVIGHELAHMWFGNLMTLKWWDDLWLNEGFASYIEYKGVDSRHPDWAMMDQFIIMDLNPVLVLDAALSSHPIVQKVGHPDEITELFDTISYNKGASVIRMLESFMGEELFRKGISNFLKKFKFSNAVTKDLWDVLQDTMDGEQGGASTVNISHVMDTWTRQKGFPVLTVIIDDSGNRVLSQQRFLSDPIADTSNETSAYGFRWEVPVTYITSESKEIQSTWLHSADNNVKVATSDNVEWIKFNHHQVGYYRVNYTELEWQTFSSLLQGNVAALDAADRANLLNDAFSLADAGLLRYEIALEGTRYLYQETEYIPWHVATSKFKKCLRMLYGSLVYPDLRSYIRVLVAYMHKNVQWTVSETDSHLNRLLRIQVLDLACTVGLSECLDEAHTLFKQWLTKPEIKPHPDLRALVYKYGMATGGTEKNWDLMWHLYLKEEDASEKLKLMEGLASIREPWLLQRFIELAKIESNVRSQDFFTVLSHISSNPMGTAVVWDFVRSEWEYLVDRFSLNDRYLGRLIPVITKSFTTQLKKEEMLSFFESYPEAGAGKSARKQALENVSNNIRWIQTHRDCIGNWLSLQVSKIFTPK